MVIKVKVKPRSDTQNVVLKDNLYCISLRSSPVESKANIELVEVLSNHFNIPKSYVIIKRGKNSLIKYIEITQ